MSDVLATDAIQVRLAAHPAWSYDGRALVRIFDRGDFNGSIAFVNAVAGAANALDHHPDLAIAWNAVTIRTSSHDVNGISERDFALIAAIEALGAPAA
jgi:4a-hydroxytetrahydrobiopterin dehydratase